MRNPWGSFEWKGDWSDESDMWDKHPAIKFEMGFHDKKSRERSDANDGEFYMSWDDFLRHFRGVDVCYTKRDLSNLHLDAKEEYGCWGPLVGCIVGKSSILYYSVPLITLNLYVISFLLFISQQDA
jgi:hypothetical protein